jgi:hypothetical protein
MIPWTNDFIEENELVLAVIKNVILSHLTTLVTQFEKYFPTDWDIEKHDCTRQPLNVPSEKTKHLSLTAQEELAKLSSDRTLQLVFRNKDMCDFWLTVNVTALSDIKPRSDLLCSKMQAHPSH